MKSCSLLYHCVADYIAWFLASLFSMDHMFDVQIVSNNKCSKVITMPKRKFKTLKCCGSRHNIGFTQKEQIHNIHEAQPEAHGTGSSDLPRPLVWHVVNKKLHRGLLSNAAGGGGDVDHLLNRWHKTNVCAKC